MEVTLSWYGVRDLETAKKFYGETLGLRQTFEMPGWAEFGSAEGKASIGLAEQSSIEAGNGSVVVLKVGDLDAARARLIERGVEFVNETEEVPGVVRLATFRDPFGNYLQIMQELIHNP